MNAAAWRVGALALTGIVLLGLAIAAVGGQWFSPRDRAVMRFERSVYGLTPGAPVRWVWRRPSAAGSPCR